MNARDYWDLFLETGAPGAYLLYTNALKTEGIHVSDHTGNRPAGHGLQ